jgi:hypothetical protein
MQVDLSSTNLSAALVARVQDAVKPAHNSVEVTMSNLSRRMWTNLRAALSASDRFTCKKEGCGMIYVLDDGTVAQRLGSNVSMVTLADVHCVPVKCTCAKKKGVLVDVPAVALRVATVSPAETPTHVVRLVRARQYVSEHTFVNSRGYEYVLGLRTPLGSCAESEKALERTETQAHTFSVRFSLRDAQHSCLYHALNALNLLEQVFHPSLHLRLS